VSTLNEEYRVFLTYENFSKLKQAKQRSITMLHRFFPRILPILMLSQLRFSVEGNDPEAITCS
jgi:hypothetical protein